jgi:hypothetical protein
MIEENKIDYSKINKKVKEIIKKTGKYLKTCEE